MDCYWQVNNDMGIWSLKLNKIGILLSYNCVSTIVWLHHLDSNEIHGEKTNSKLHKDTSCCFEQILEAASYKTAAVQPLTSYLTNKDKLSTAYMYEFLSNILQWTPTHGQTSWLTSKNLHSSALCRHWMPSRGPTKSNG